MMTPDSEAALAEAVAGAKGPLRIQGGGTRPIGQAEGEVLGTAGLSGIELYEPGALTLVAKAGTPVAVIEAALAKENQRLPFEPMDHRALLGTKGEPTIGGVVATNASGPRRIQAGACRDSLIGVRSVDGQGSPAMMWSSSWQGPMAHWASCPRWASRCCRASRPLRHWC